MASYIVDTSIIAQIVVEQTYTAQTEILLEEASSGTHYLFVPDFCRIELVNVVWKHVQRRLISIQESETLVRDIKRLPIHLVSTKSFELAALKIGIKHGLAIYDCVHIAIATERNLPLITADAKQAAAASAEGVALKAISDFIPTAD